MNSEKTNGVMAIISLTQIEFGSMTFVLDNLEKARVKKEYDVSLRQMKAFLRSMSKIGVIAPLPDDFYVISVHRVLALQSFPADVFFEIVIAEAVKND